jgi:uncharacterized protein
MLTVLDSNIVVSALLFRKSAEPLYRAIIEGMVVPFRSPSIMDEYRRVLSYVKFGLSADDVRYLLEEEIKPFYAERPEPPRSGPWIAEDPSDDKFVDLAISIPGAVLVSGDRHILDQAAALPCKVVSLAEAISSLVR